MLCGAGIPSAKGPVKVVRPGLPPWKWREPVVIFPGGSADQLIDALGLDATPAPLLVIADSGVLVALGERGGKPTVVHACAEVGILRRYVDGAEQARAALSQTGFARLVPLIDCVIQHEQHACLYQTCLQGRVVRARGQHAAALRAHVQAALRPLEGLYRSSRNTPDPADDAWIDMLDRDLGAIPEWVEPLTVPLAALPDLGVRYETPAVFVHGDYWLANVLFEPGREEVCGIIDWERARPQGLAGFDALHLVMHAFAAWRGCSAMRVPVMMWLDQCEPLLEQLLADAAAAVHLDQSQMREVALALWLGHLHQHRHDRSHWRRERLDDWLLRPAAAAAHWLAVRAGT